MSRCRSMLMACAMIVLLSGPGPAADVERHGFPRLIGMNIARPVDYDKPWYQDGLSRMDIAIIGFWAGWRKSKPGVTERDVVRMLKRRNPQLLVGQYTILNECRDAEEQRHSNSDISEKIEKENWWLRDESGERVRWTKRYGAWDINISQWAGSPISTVAGHAELQDVLRAGAGVRYLVSGQFLEPSPCGIRRLGRGRPR